MTQIEDKNPEQCDQMLTEQQSWSVYIQGSMADRLRRIADFLDRDPKFVLAQIEISDEGPFGHDGDPILKAAFDYNWSDLGTGLVDNGL